MVATVGVFLTVAFPVFLEIREPATEFGGNYCSLGECMLTQADETFTISDIQGVLTEVAPHEKPAN